MDNSTGDLPAVAWVVLSSTIRGSSLTYAVVTDELARAAEAVREITASAAAGLVEALPQLATSIGHDGLEATLRDFCAMWDTGLSHLVWSDARGGYYWNFRFDGGRIKLVRNFEDEDGVLLEEDHRSTPSSSIPMG